MQIGGVSFNNPVILAPMAGVTDLIFRRICKSMGSALSVTEMISAKGLIYTQKETLKIADINEEGKTAIQLFGSEENSLRKAVNIVNEIGPDLLDFNMGCPATKIIKNKEGSALMTDPKKAEALLKALVEEAAMPVTVKIRLGWDQQNKNFLNIAQRAKQAGVAAVALHARTRDQYYSGQADWGAIAQLKKAVKIPIIGNGDIWQGEDALRIMEETGCDMVMVGRGVMGNPWLIRDSVDLLSGGVLKPKPTLKERIDLALDHMQSLIEYKGEYIAVREMRKHAAWYLKGQPRASEVRVSINSAKTHMEMRDLLLRYLSDNLE